MFAAMEQYTDGPRAGQWYEKYWHVGPEGWEGGYEDEDGWAVIEPDPTYWYIKLGEVSLPENHQRTIDLDTGILGTEQFNTEWALNPDALPLRIELGCTIGDEDAGPTPYVYWGQSLVRSEPTYSASIAGRSYATAATLPPTTHGTTSRWKARTR